MKLRLIGSAFAIALLFAGVMVSAETTVKKVTSGAWDGWFLYDDNTDTVDNSLGEFVIGPASPTLGIGSLEIAEAPGGRPNVATRQFAGTTLAGLTELGFDTYNSSDGNPSTDTQRAAYLQFNVDFNSSDTWQRRLVFVPRQNGTVLQDTWQHWDALQGGNALWVYSGATWPVTGQSGSTPKTWNQILADYPGAKMLASDPFLGLRVGEPYSDGFVGNVDNIRVGVAGNTVAYDFEPKASDVCKKNAWSTQPRYFSNQGDCVSYVVNGSK